ncbi:MAG: SPOR domain-containing protein [Alphaproteobacteria bacterium]|nr:SPOR domain-containing protein [Alphaproteobacteria bacterium]
MEEFDKIKAFSESVAERQANLAENADVKDIQDQTKENSELDFPKYLSQFRPQVTEEKKESNLLVWALSGLALVLLAGVGGFFYFYAPSDNTQEIVVIAPTPTPVKVRPENPGGLQISGTDKVAYNRTSAHKAEVVEKLFPEPEQPVAPPVEQILTPEEILPPVPQEVEDATEAVMSVVPEEVVEGPVVQEEVPVQPVQKVSVQKEEKTVIKVEAKPQEKPVVTTPKELWRAQLLSSSNKGKVESAWKGILKKNNALLSDMPYQIVPVKIPGKGTFYRLQVGEFTTKEMVLNLCDKLKKKKQDCIPVKADK